MHSHHPPRQVSDALYMYKGFSETLFTCPVDLPTHNGLSDALHISADQPTHEGFSDARFTSSADLP